VCNLYNIKVTRLEFNAYFQATDDVRDEPTVEKPYVAAPRPGALGSPGYIVREKEDQRVLSVMRWGFPRPDGKAVVNVRNYTSPFWIGALKNPARRCLVPFTSFQEWSVEPDPVTGKKTPFWFSLPASPIAAFAGLWRPTGSGGVYAFLTSGYEGDPAVHVVGAIHPKACPVILHPEDYNRWLHAPVDEALTLASPFPSQLMAVV
jgi:putative SOS response-associated peptidase YedK